ncbi:hypothetical protein Tco_0584188 [Tanacetum coccineum]
MLYGYQITTSDFLPWIPLTQPSTYEVRGPSSAVTKAPHPVGRPLSVVASRVALHHREIEALCMRADKMEDMQTRALSLVIKVDGVDALREEMDGLHGSTETMSQQIQTLETALQEVRAENQDLRNRLSASVSNERCMVASMLWIEERISALELRPQGPPDGSQ